MKTWTLIDKAFALKKSALFSDLDLDLLLAIGDKMNTTHFEEGQIIFPINQEAHRMYFIAEGSVCIEDEENQLLSELPKGDFFGDESLFNDKPRSYQAKAKKESTLLTLSKTHLMTIIEECPSVAIRFLYAFALSTGFRNR
jgi:CRP-like cAMP-binding protein